MPVYQIKDPKTGRSLKVTSNRQPTPQEALDLFAEYSPERKEMDKALSMGIDPFGLTPEQSTQAVEEKQKLDVLTGAEQKDKITEEQLVKTPEWIKAAKSVYKLNEGDDAPGLDSDREYANYGLRYMGWFNYNFPKMGLEATQVQYGTDEQKQEFINLMELYDEKAPSAAGFGRAIKGIATDPTTLGGIAAFGLKSASKEAVKKSIKEALKVGTKESIKKAGQEGFKHGSKVGAIEGAIYTAADNALRQTAKINAGVQDEYSLGEIGQASLLGAGAGVALGGSFGGLGAYKSAGGKINPFTKKSLQAGDEDVVVPNEIKPEQPFKEFEDLDPEIKIRSPLQKQIYSFVKENPQSGLADIKQYFKEDFNKIRDAANNLYEKGYLTRPTSQEKYSVSTPVIKETDPFVLNEDTGLITRKVNTVDYTIAPTENNKFEVFKSGKRTKKEIDTELENVFKNKKAENLSNKQIDVIRNDLTKETINKPTRIFDNLDEAKDYIETISISRNLPPLLRPEKLIEPRTARDYIRSSIDKDYYEFGELTGAIGDRRGQIPVWARARKPNATQALRGQGQGIRDKDEIFERMAEDQFYPGKSPGDDIPQSIYDDLAEDRIHPDDQVKYQQTILENQRKEADIQLLRDNDFDVTKMTDEQVAEALDDIQSGMVPPKWINEQAPEFDELLERRTFANEYSEQFAREIRDRLPAEAIEPDFTPAITTKNYKEYLRIGTQVLEDLNIPLSKKRITDQIFETISLLNVNDDIAKSFNKVLAKNDLTMDEFNQLARFGISEDARRMNLAGQAKKAIEKKMSQEALEVLDTVVNEAKDTSFATRLKYLKEMDNLRRGLLVTQIGTAVRNFLSLNPIRTGLHTMSRLVNEALNVTINPVRDLLGKEQVPVDINNIIGLAMNISVDVKSAKKITDWAIEHYPKQKYNLFTTYASEVADHSTKDNKVFKFLQKGVDGLNWLNRTQEYYFRRGMFATSLADSLRKRGLDIKKIISENNIDAIPVEDIQNAVNDALDYTYALTPKAVKKRNNIHDTGNYIATEFIKLANMIPFVTTAALPFPRFIVNALRHLFEYSPFGFTTLLSEKEMARIAAGDLNQLSKAVVGSAMLLAAIEAKRKGYGGEKWYELNGTDGTTIDTRPFFPISAYLLAADQITRIESGRKPLEARELLEGTTGSTFRFGVGLRVVDDLIGVVDGTRDEKKLTEKLQSYAGDIASTFLTPIRQFNDFVDSQGLFPEEQKFRTAGDNSFGEIFQKNIPFLREKLPLVESPTRAEAPGRPQRVRIPGTNITIPGPAARQLFGVPVIEPKNIAEKELDRLGFSRREIVPYTGDRVLDQIRYKYYGPIIEIRLEQVITGDKYKALSNPLKSEMLRKELTKIRANETLNKLIEAEGRKDNRYAKYLYRKLPKNIRRALAQAGIELE